MITIVSIGHTEKAFVYVTVEPKQGEVRAACLCLRCTLSPVNHEPLSCHHDGGGGGAGAVTSLGTSLEKKLHVIPGR